MQKTHAVTVMFLHYDLAAMNSNHGNPYKFNTNQNFISDGVHWNAVKKKLIEVKPLTTSS